MLQNLEKGRGMLPVYMGAGRRPGVGQSGQTLGPSDWASDWGRSEVSGLTGKYRDGGAP